MRLILLIIFSVFFFQARLTAQNTIIFKGQVVNTAFVIQKNVELQINHRFATTNDSGYFQFLLPKTNTHLQLSIPDKENIVIYPLGGYISIPRELKDITLIVIGRPSELIPFEKYLSYVRLLNTAAESEKPGLKKVVDSLKNTLSKFGIRDGTIANGENWAREKENYITELTAGIIQYQNSVIELKNNFKWIAVRSLEDGIALNALLHAANAYNITYNEFDRQHMLYEGWEWKFGINDHLQQKIKAYSKFITLKVHATGVYPMQELIIQIRQYYSGKKKSKELRKLLEEQINKQFKVIENLMPELDRKTKEIIVSIALS